MDENKINTKMIIMVALVTVVVLAIGTTYAYFTANVQGNDDANPVKVTTGKLIIDFTSSAYISNTNGQLLTSENYKNNADKNTFTVKHNSNSTAAATYSLQLSDISITDNFKTKDFKWELEKDGSQVSSGDFSTLSGTTMALTSEQSLPLEQEDNYTLRVWLQENGSNQAELSEGSFSAKIELNATNTRTTP